MAGAVADREQSLRARIRTLEIAINQQALRGRCRPSPRTPTVRDQFIVDRRIGRLSRDRGSPTARSSWGSDW